MALSIITGSLATTDMTIATVSVKCAFGRMALQFVRGGFRTTTFCSASWVEEVGGEIQGVGSLLGYTTKGWASASPLAWITAPAPIAFVMTADTSCTLTGLLNVFSDGLDLVAQANSGRNVDFRTSNTVAAAWVVV
jgi:hypothetical protein